MNNHENGYFLFEIIGLEIFLQSLGYFVLAIERIGENVVSNVVSDFLLCFDIVKEFIQVLEIHLLSI